MLLHISTQGFLWRKFAGMHNPSMITGLLVTGESERYAVQAGTIL